MKKYIEHLSELSSIKLFFVRYFVNFILLIEILYLPIVLNQNDFIKLELFKNILLFIPIVLLGINSGFINLYYRRNIIFKNEIIYIGFIISFITFCIIYYIYNDLFIAIAFFCFVFLISIEKILIVDGFLILASIYKSFFSISLIILITIYSDTYDIIYMYSICIIIATFFWLSILVYKYNLTKNKIIFPVFSKILIAFKELIREGFFIAMQSFLLIGFFLFDRWFILENYSNYVSEYSISFSFSQIVFIALNTIAFSMQKKLGENLNNFKKNKIKKLVKINFYFFIFLEFSAISIIYFLIILNIFPQYGNFIFSFIIITFFYGIYYLFSTYNIIALYNGYILKLFYWMLISLLVNIVLSFILLSLDFSYYFILLKSGVVLCILSLLCYRKVLGISNNG